MPLLSQLVKILDWVENAQNFIDFLQQPVGIAAIATLLCYAALQSLGWDSLSATILTCTVSLSALYATSGNRC